VAEADTGVLVGGANRLPKASSARRCEPHCWAGRETPCERGRTKGASRAILASLVRLLKFFDERGDDFEEVADDAVVGYFEDGGVLVFVDCGDGA
jgi:hypothetical protein